LGAIRLSRPPQTDDELWLVIVAFWGIRLPRVQVCKDHVAPFTAVAHAYFSREPNFAVWYASRGSGKSLALAVLGLTKTFVAGADCTILGGSIWQSQNVRDHMRKMLQFKNAPNYAVKRDITTMIETTSGNVIKPLPASQTSVRGPHPPLQLLDEIDEMDYDLYMAALGQAMEQLNSRGEVIGEYIVASSTWQNPIGTMTTVIEDARKKGLPVFTWCWRELLAENGGWMSRRFIESKRKAVSEVMWSTEYELNEPSSSSRAIDLEAVERFFVEYPKPVREEHSAAGDDDIWVWEDPVATASYAAGADWAKEKDKTVIVVIRTDVLPRRVVALRRMNRKRYPVMTRAFVNWVKKYGCEGISQHDKTGVGNALNDFLPDEIARGFVMAGRPRSQMFSDYIADFEHGGYELPRTANDFYKSHRGATVADVFAPHKWDEHTPDDLVAMGMAHRAAGRTPPPGEMPDLEKDDTPREVDKRFHVTPDNVRTDGEVTIVDHRYDTPASVAGDPLAELMSVGPGFSGGASGWW
jgi:hypothetical protein